MSPFCWCGWLAPASHTSLRGQILELVTKTADSFCRGPWLLQTVGVEGEGREGEEEQETRHSFSKAFLEILSCSCGHEKMKGSLS